MKPKSLRLLPALSVGILTVAAASSASAALAVVNGNFEITTGLTNLGGGWYGGVPTGWNGPGQNYGVGGIGSGGGVTSITANLEQAAKTTPSFSPLYQDLGVLGVESTITLSFDFSRPWNGAGDLGVAIWAAGSYSNVLASAALSTTGAQTLTVADIPAGTAIRIGFWRSNATGAPGLDNVAIVATAVPEPSAIAMAGLGMTGLLVSGRRRRVENKAIG